MIDERRRLTRGRCRTGVDLREFRGGPAPTGPREPAVCGGPMPRPRLSPLQVGLSIRVIRAVAKMPPSGTEGICAATLTWTIVVLRDGRRSRPWRADVAQLVAHHLAKVRVAGSNPVIRSMVQSHQPQRWSGRVVRQRPAKPCTRVRFPSPPPRWVPRD
jgi:hypothetical protein